MSKKLAEPCAACGKRASHEYTPPLFPGRLLLCNDCNPTRSPIIGGPSGDSGERGPFA
jgi:hypothetical protein